MTNRRAEVALVGFLLAGCVAAIVFVFSVLSSPGGEFKAQERTAKKAPSAQPRPRDPAATPRESETTPTPAPVEEGPPAAEAEGDKGPAPDKKSSTDDPHELAELTIELLVPEAAPDKVIEVVVRDEAGDPIEDALVVFRQGPALLYRERTDVEGGAGFMPLEMERGPFRVDAIADGFVAATADSVAAGATTELILKARPAIEGVVIAPSKGRGLVKLFTSDSMRVTNVKNDGTFSFEDLEEGFVTVQAEVAPYGVDSVTFYLEGGTQRFVRMRIKKRSHLRIHGVILHWPKKGTVKINGVSAPVTPSGSYHFKHAVIGLNEIEIDAPGKGLLRERFSVKGNSSSRYDFSLSREGRIKGRVRDEKTRQPVRDALVRLGVEFGDPKNDRVPLFPIEKVPVVKTDRDGKFEVKRLDKRLIYMLSVVAPGRGQALVEGVVPDGGHRTVMMPAGPFLYGRLAGRGGVPKDATVTALRLEDTPNGRRFNVPDYDGSESGRDRKGFYGLAGLLPGTYLVRVKADRYGTIETVVDMTEGLRLRLDLRMKRYEQLEDRDADLLHRLPPSISTDPEDLPPSEITLLHVDANRPLDQRPFPGVRVSFWEGAEETSPRLSFTELEFELVGLTEGSYRAILTHPSLERPIVHDRFTMRRGEPVKIVLR